MLGSFSGAFAPISSPSWTVVPVVQTRTRNGPGVISTSGQSSIVRCQFACRAHEACCPGPRPVTSCGVAFARRVVGPQRCSPFPSDGGQPRLFGAGRAVSVVSSSSSP